MKHSKHIKKFILSLLLAAAFSNQISAQSSTPLVYGIEALGVSNSIITISWNLPLKTENSYINSLVLYRDSRPITSYTQILKLNPVTTLPHGTVSYNDKVSDTKEYYYAVISLTLNGNREKEDLYYDEELDSPEKTGEGSPYALILPGVNATVNGAKTKVRQNTKKTIPQTPAQTEKKKYGNNSLRELPLPYIDVLGDEIKPLNKISEKANDKALSLTKKSGKNLKTLEPYIFEEDLVSPPGGDEYLLFEVLRTSFIKRNYAKSIKDLNLFLAQNHSVKVAQRAHFYLGQSYYFSGEYSKALTQFLELDEEYPALSRKWAESTLDLFSIPE